MRRRDVVVVGASAGGVAALRKLVSQLPPEFAASILVVLHLHPSSPGYLPEILSRSGPLPARPAEADDAMVHGQIYVAPPDRHLLVTADGRLEVSRGPKENRSRPAIDPLFQSAALACGRRVIGVILTGYLDDGSAGLRAIQLCGGITVVQDPKDAAAPSMPSSALHSVDVDHCVPIDRMGRLLIELVSYTVDEEDVVKVMPKHLQIEAAIAAGDVNSLSLVSSIGKPTLLTCPECHGVLSVVEDGSLVRFRCHTGHAYSHQNLRAALYEKAEDELWGAVRVLQERAIFMTHFARHASGNCDHANAKQWSDEVERALAAAEAVRRVQRDPASAEAVSASLIKQSEP